MTVTSREINGNIYCSDGRFALRDMRWRTPKYFMTAILEELGFVEFDVDVTGEEVARHARSVISIEKDCLHIDRWAPENGAAWMNPPYGATGISSVARRRAQEDGIDPATLVPFPGQERFLAEARVRADRENITVVCLVAGTMDQWACNAAAAADRVLYPGRVCHVDLDGVEQTQPRGPHMVLIYTGPSTSWRRRLPAAKVDYEFHKNVSYHRSCAEYRARFEASGDVVWADKVAALRHPLLT